MFHVPEYVRIRAEGHPFRTDMSDGNNGAFDLAGPEPGWRLAIIASDGTDPATPHADGWEHVSVHAYNERGRERTPNWKEMCVVKGLFWDDEDVVVQFHPRRSEYVNQHPGTLHLWRTRHVVFPTPPPELVGVR
jgi:hypothetical protein